MSTFTLALSLFPPLSHQNSGHLDNNYNYILAQTIPGGAWHRKQTQRTEEALAA